MYIMCIYIYGDHQHPSTITRKVDKHESCFLYVTKIDELLLALSCHVNQPQNDCSLFYLPSSSIPPWSKQSKHPRSHHGHIRSPPLETPTRPFLRTDIRPDMAMSRFEFFGTKMEVTDATDVTMWNIVKQHCFWEREEFRTQLSKSAGCHSIRAMWHGPMGTPKTFTAWSHKTQ